MTTSLDALAAVSLAAFAHRRAAPPVVFGFDISRDRQHAAVVALTRIGNTTHIHLIGQTMPDTSAEPTPSFREQVEAALPPHAHIDGPGRGNWSATWTTRKGLYTFKHCTLHPTEHTTRITGPDTTVLLQRPTAENVIVHLLHMGAIELADDQEGNAADAEHVWPSQLAELIETWVSRYRTGTYPIATETAVRDCRHMLVCLETLREELAQATAQLAGVGEAPIGLGASLAASDRRLGPGEPRLYMLDYREFWADLIEPEGVLDRDALGRELSDYRFMMSEVSTVYAQLTGGVLSKPHYRGDEVVAAAEEHFAAVYARLLCERAQHCQDNDAFMGANVLRKLANEWQPGAWHKFRQSLKDVAAQPLATGGIVHGPGIGEMSASVNSSPGLPNIHIAAAGQLAPTAALREAIENFAQRQLRHGGQ